MNWYICSDHIECISIHAYCDELGMLEYKSAINSCNHSNMPSNTAAEGNLDVFSVVQAIVGEIYPIRFRQDADGAFCTNHISPRQKSQIRQLAMYLCHIILGLSMRQVAKGYFIDRSSVSYACRMTEERRELPEFDALVSQAERLVALIVMKAD